MDKIVNSLKKPILTVLNVFAKWKRERKWHQQTKYWRKILNSKETKPLDTSASYLILAPHADDEWIGCSQIITGCEQSVILNMDMQGGDTKEMHIQRFNELRTLTDKYSRKLITVGENKTDCLIDILTTQKPDYVCLPHYFDWHPEHIQVMGYLKQALSRITYCGKVLMYQVSLPMLPKFINCSVPVSRAAFMEKWNVFEKIYKTQTIISYRRFMANERINGALSCTYSAEVYSILDTDEWYNDIENRLFNDKEKDAVKQDIQDITLTRRIIASIMDSKESSANNKNI